jgi:hypothetical protein
LLSAFSPFEIRVDACAFAHADGDFLWARADVFIENVDRGVHRELEKYVEHAPASARS